ncbi:MAG: CRISPR-associated helicase Cas3' [Treponema sp.]|jgi:CRISPR-associated endonuclease/helicase Cas3|nr:CRISPR-associated helicase Cas3' [Treponema sp.]
MEHIAHVRELDNGNWAEPQLLETHLLETAELAAAFAAEFGSREWGYALGFSHDGGKGTPEWQKYLNNKSGYNEEASSEAPGRVEHSGPGAKLAEEVFGKMIGRSLSYCIAGHHAGLPDWLGSQAALAFRLQNSSTKDIDEELKASLLNLCPKNPPWKFCNTGLDISLWIRMLFSCLVDADRLNTEKYMTPEQSKEREGYSNLAELHRRFNGYMESKTSKSQGFCDEKVYDARQQVLADCRKVAEERSGFFSLTVPTGGGKTLSSMAFALKHAELHNKKRIIYVIPYTSIIEQNANVFSEVFGDDEIVEHHSNLDDDETTVRARLAAENWDAPIIVTTSVQFFESLFAAKTNRCRKLHNIVNSVVVLDEAQLVPTDYLEPILETMRLLVEHYRVSFVICTATQPVFEKIKEHPGFPGLPEGSIREIIQDVSSLYKNLERVKVEYPQDLSVSVEWKDLADELSQYSQVLCVVSDRKSCRELHALMPKGTYHLSALMCAQHRSDIITEIKEKLRRGDNVRVISTQLVEAGVDMDFPVVYRALAGLDSIAQAAGRCNREGKLNAQGELGKVVVFKASRKTPAGILRKASEIAERMISKGINNLIDRRIFPPYFSELYWKVNSLDTKEIMKLLKIDSSDLGIQFRTAAGNFKIINDANQCSIIVPYGEGKKWIELLKNSKIPTGKVLRKLQRYTINIYRDQFSCLQGRGSLEEIISGLFALNNTVEYNDQIGLLIDGMPNDPVDFICQ